MFWVSLESNKEYSSTLQEFGFDDSSREKVSAENNLQAADSLHREVQNEVIGEPSSEPLSASSVAVKILVVLRDGHTGEPVAHAKVWTYPYSMPEQNPQVHTWLMQGKSPIWIGEQFHTPVLSNLKGEAWIHHYPDGQSVVASDLELYGFNLHHHENIRLITLWKEASVTLSFRNHEGQALANLPVGLARVTEKKTEFLLGTVVLSDSNGEASLQHLATWKTQKNPEQLHVRPFVHLRDPVGIPLLTWPSDYLPTLTMPPLGSLKVRVVDQNQDLIHQSVPVLLAIDPNPEQGFVLRRHPPNRYPSGGLTALTEGGIATFPFLGLGLDLAGMAPLADPMESTRVYGAGPWKEGQKTVLEARPLATATTLHFRVFDSSGEVLRSTPLQMILDSGHILPSRIAIETDDSGEVHMPLGRFQHADLRSSKNFVVRHSSQDFSSIAQAEVQLPELKTGTIEIGDIHLAPLAAYLSGQVFDPQGNPLHAVYIRMTDPNEVKLFAHSDAQVRFFKETDELGASFRIDIHQPGFIPLVMDLPNTGQDIEIVLTPGLTIHGTIIPPSGMTLQELSVAVLDPEGERLTYIDDLRGDGSFLLEGLESGTVGLAVYEAKYSTQIFTVSGINPTSKDSPPDPRLDPLDLTDLLHFCALLVVDDRGTPLKYVRVYRLGDDNYGGWISTDKDGLAQIPLGPKGAKCLLTANGFQPQEVNLQRSDQTIVLGNGFQTEIQLNPVPILPPGISMGGAFWLYDETVRNPISTGMVFFNATGATTAALPGAGDLHASIWLLKDGDLVGFLDDWDPNAPTNSVKVSPSDLNGTILFPIDLKQVAKLLDDA